LLKEVKNRDFFLGSWLQRLRGDSWSWTSNETFNYHFGRPNKLPLEIYLLALLLVYRYFFDWNTKADSWLTLKEEIGWINLLSFPPRILSSSVIEFFLFHYRLLIKIVEQTKLEDATKLSLFRITGKFNQIVNHNALKGKHLSDLNLRKLWHKMAKFDISAQILQQIANSYLNMHKNSSFKFRISNF
jgi:hypothetical protein